MYPFLVGLGSIIPLTLYRKIVVKKQLFYFWLFSEITLTICPL